MHLNERMKIIVAVILVVIVIAATSISLYYVYEKASLPQIGVQTFNSTRTFNSNVSCESANQCLSAITALSKISEPGYKNSSITLTVLPSILLFEGLNFYLKVWINGSLPWNLKPSALIITQSFQSPDVPYYVYELKNEYLCSTYTNNTNISIKKYPAAYPSAYTFNSSANATMNIDEYFANDSLSSNTSTYHFSSFVYLTLRVAPFNVKNGTAHNWTLLDLLPDDFTTGITITGLSKTVQEHVQIDIMRGEDTNREKNISANPYSYTFKESGLNGNTWSVTLKWSGGS